LPRTSCPRFIKQEWKEAPHDNVTINQSEISITRSSGPVLVFQKLSLTLQVSEGWRPQMGVRHWLEDESASGPFHSPLVPGGNRKEHGFEDFRYIVFDDDEKGGLYHKSSTFGDMASSHILGIQMRAPLWSVGVLLTILPLRAVVAVLMSRYWRYRKQLRHAGLCPVCSYDLRATPDRCPECGTPVAKEPA
jgi:hypothetical protein